MFRPTMILYPTDFSDSSQYAFRVAQDMAQANGGKLVIFHVAETIGSENVTFGEAEHVVQPSGYQQRLVEEIKRVHPIESADLDVEYLITEGDPQRKIVETASQLACDLIVLGMHGRTGWRRLLMGSTAEYVVRHASCPVLTIRLPAPAE